MPFVRSLASPSVKAVLGSSVLFLVPVPRQDFGASFWLAILFAPLPDGIYFAWIRAGYWLWTLLLQTPLFFTLLFFFRRHLRTRWIGAILLALPPLLSYPICFGAIWLDSRLIPALYRGLEPPPQNWPESGRLERAQLLAPAGSRYAALERSSRAWLVLHRTHEPVVLQPDSCTWADSPPRQRRGKI
jgi:hypothetical protein